MFLIVEWEKKLVTLFSRHPVLQAIDQKAVLQHFHHTLAQSYFIKALFKIPAKPLKYDGITSIRNGIYSVLYILFNAWSSDEI